MLRDLSPSLPALAVIALIVAFFLYIIFRERRRLRRLRENHAKSHREMSDDEFIRTLGLDPTATQTVLAVRRGIAAEMGVPSEDVHPSDEWTYFHEFGFDGMDFIEVVFCVEDALGISIPDSAAEELACIRPLNVADMIRWLVAKDYMRGRQPGPAANRRSGSQPR